MHQHSLFLHLPSQHSQPRFQVLNPLVLSIAATAALKFIDKRLNGRILCLNFFALLLDLLLQFSDKLGLSRYLLAQLRSSPLEDAHQRVSHIVYLRVKRVNCRYYFR